MSENSETAAESPADRYRRLSETMSDTVRAVPDDAWDRPSPCEEWTVREVLGHVLESTGNTAAKVGVELPAEPTLADDPAGAWSATRDAVVAALDDPEVADREYEGMGGSTTFADTLGTFFCIDLVVHRWDIARGAGLDATIPAQDIDLVQPMVQGLGDMIRSPGGMAAAVEVPADADEQTKFLAYLGRAS